MKRNWIKISDIPKDLELARTLPKKSTLFKWHHYKRHPRLFRKIGRSLYLDLDCFYRMADEGRLAGSGKKKNP